MAALLTPKHEISNVTITLDWLAFTFKEYTFEAESWIHTHARDKSAVSIAPTNGYKSAYRTTEKVDVMWNTDRPEMGYHVVIAGTAIRNLCEHLELDQKALLESVVHAGASITRLDLAKDLYGSEFSLTGLYNLMERGERTGTARSIAQITSLNGGHTIYIGSRKSDRFFRIYDKAAEQGLQGELWTRFEVETKGMVARSLATELLKIGGSWSDYFGSIARRMVDVPKHDTYQQVLQIDAKVGLPKIEKSTDREKWIQTQVIPAVIKHFTENRESRAVALLRQMLEFIAQGDILEA